MLRWTGPGASIAVFLMTLSCGGTQSAIDLGNLSSSVSESPRITALNFLGQASKASDIFIFDIDFDDADGDVGSGKLFTYINQESNPFVEANLKLTFFQSEVDPKAKKGTLRIITQIAFKSPVQTGQNSPIEITYQLKDAKGHDSNKATARLLIEF